MMKCKWDEKADCHVTEILKRDLVDRDCFFCMASIASNIAKELVEMFCEVGAQSYSFAFMDLFVRFLRARETLLSLTEKYYPEALKGESSYDGDKA